MKEQQDHTKNKEFINWQHVVKACCQNDRSGQEKLYRHFFPIMERMVLRHTQDEDKIIDILNDGFLRVFQKIHLFEWQGSFEGWIRRIMYHSISNYFRKKNSDLKFLLYEDYIGEQTVVENHSLYYQDLIKLVEKLPEKHMRVFHLYAIEGFSQKEIADQLKMNPNTCRWYLSEARKLLQEAYNSKYLKDYNEAG